MEVGGGVSVRGDTRDSWGLCWHAEDGRSPKPKHVIHLYKLEKARNVSLYTASRKDLSFAGLWIVSPEKPQTDTELQNCESLCKCLSFLLFIHLHLVGSLAYNLNICLKARRPSGCQELINFCPHSHRVMVKSRNGSWREGSPFVQNSSIGTSFTPSVLSSDGPFFKRWHDSSFASSRFESFTGNFLCSANCCHRLLTSVLQLDWNTRVRA